MPRKRLIWQFYPSFLLTTLVAVGLFSAAALFMAQHQYEKDLKASLNAQSLLLGESLRVDSHWTNAVLVQAACQRAGDKLQTRFTVIHPDGTVYGDSQADPAAMENHGQREEVSQAFHTGHPGISTRYSTTIQRRLLYYCQPILTSEGVPLFAVRAAYPLARVLERDRALALQVGAAGIAVLLLAALLSLWITRRVTRPLAYMRDGAKRFASGDLTYRMPLPEYEEMASLADAMNRMAFQIAERIETVARERNQRDAVFASMCEGVLAIGTDQTILHINAACCQMLGTSAAGAKRRKLQEVVRNARLQRFAQEVLGVQEEHVVNADIVLDAPSERQIQARGTSLLNADHEKIGALLVLNDVTRMHRLEAMRTDFVANVSHELKTPITSIKGFVETLLDRAADDPEAQKRFLSIIARQADHLDAIVNDLLTLSRVEHDSTEMRLERSPTRMRPILADALDICAPKAIPRGTKLDLECPQELEAALNPHLFEQAVINLVENAIKYSPDGARVTVSAKALTQHAVQVDVKDTGPGIAQQHLERLFERFYRVDKGRSRMLGGTGLGLAIVKHITLIHEGTISVESNLGAGSTFSIVIPAKARAVNKQPQ